MEQCDPLGAVVDDDAQILFHEAPELCRLVNDNDVGVRPTESVTRSCGCEADPVADAFDSLVPVGPADLEIVVSGVVEPSIDAIELIENRGDFFLATHDDHDVLAVEEVFDQSENLVPVHSDHPPLELYVSALAYLSALRYHGCYDK